MSQDWKIGKTYEGLYGEEKAKQMKIKQSNNMKRRHQMGMEDVYKKVSNSLKGKKFTEEHRRKLSEWQIGRKLSEKTKQKMREASKLRKEKYGYINSPETRIRISNTLKGHILDNSTKEKISESVKKAYKNNPNIVKIQIETRKKSYNEERMLQGRQKFIETLKSNPSIMKKAGKIRSKTFRENPEIIKKIKGYRATQIFPIKDTKIEVKIQNFLKQLGIEFFTHQYMKEIEHGYQCDILIPFFNIVIECDGDYWHNYPIGTDVDSIRTKELMEKGFKVLRLWESEIESMNLEEFVQAFQGRQEEV